MSASNAQAAAFFSDAAAKQGPDYTTLEEQVESKVPRDRYDRPLIKQPDGSMEPYNRASSYGGQIEDKTNVEEWTRRQVVRGLAMQPDLLNMVPERLKLDPWADMERSDKKTLSSISDRAQDVAGSNLKSALGTDIHYATEVIDLGDSLEDKLRDFEPQRRALLIDRANAYYRVVKDYGLVFDSVETFGVQDEVKVAGTWDRRGRIPWWREWNQNILDVKTSGSMDFAGIGFAVQLSTYAHMCAYDHETGERIPHEGMNTSEALIIHVERHLGGAVELYPVNISEGWRQARLAREIILARRLGKTLIRQLDEREALMRSATSKVELLELKPQIDTWPPHLRKLANELWALLP